MLLKIHFSDVKKQLKIVFRKFENASRINQIACELYLIFIKKIVFIKNKFQGNFIITLKRLGM